MSDNANMIIEIIRMPQNINKIYYEFDKNIFENLYFINTSYLLGESKNIDFQQIWNLNPQKFCYDTYGIQELVPVILLVNKLNSMFEFKAERLKQSIVTPSIYSIYKVLMLIA